MKKISSRLVAIFFLTLLILGSSVPVVAESDAYSGTYGGLTWAFDASDGVLTITGSGQMRDFGSIQYSEAWLAHKASIRSVVIGGGISSIGTYAFRGCKVLTEIVIPDSVTVIGGSAFDGCVSMKHFCVPKNVVEIRDKAFSNCDVLESLTVESGNEKYHSAGNCIIETESRTLMFGCNESEIPQDGSVIAIGSLAFHDCNFLTEIVFPEALTSIGHAAFYGCDRLNNVVIPKGVTGNFSISFAACPSLDRISVEEGNERYHSDGNCVIETESKTLVIGCKGSVIPSDGSVTTLKSRSFLNCDSLESITVPGAVTQLEFGIFDSCDLLTDVFFEDGVTRIESTVFSDCKSLKRVVLPKSVKYIGGSILYGCSNVSIYYRGTETAWNKIEKSSSWKSGAIRCGVIYHESHTWSDWKITAESTHTEEGLRTQSCACGAVKTETLEKLPDHTYGECVKYDAEKHQRVCVCGDAQYDDHAWGDGEITLEPTHTETGVRAYTCVCGETKTETLEVLSEHTYGEWTKHDENQHKKSCACGDVQYETHSYEPEYTCVVCGFEADVPEMDTAPADTDNGDSEEASLNESSEELLSDETSDTTEETAGCALTVLSGYGMLFLISLGGLALKKKR